MSSQIINTDNRLAFSYTALQLVLKYEVNFMVACLPVVHSMNNYLASLFIVIVFTNRRNAICYLLM